MCRCLSQIMEIPRDSKTQKYFGFLLTNCREIHKSCSRRSDFSKEELARQCRKFPFYMYKNKDFHLRFIVYIIIVLGLKTSSASRNINYQGHIKKVSKSQLNCPDWKLSVLVVRPICGGNKMKHFNPFKLYFRGKP